MPPRVPRKLGLVRAGHHYPEGEQRKLVRAAGATAVYATVDDLFGAARPGDTIVVSRLDRLGTSVTEVLRTVDRSVAFGLGLQSLAEDIVPGTPRGKQSMTVLRALADGEQILMNERAAAARALSRKDGARSGRPALLTDEQVAVAVAMRSAGRTAQSIADAVGVSRATLYRAFDRG